MWITQLPRLVFAALFLLFWAVRASGAAPEAVAPPPPACDSLVERYVFMRELSGSSTDVASVGWLLDEAVLSCEPFADAPMPRSLRGRRVILTQHGVREGQWWYKVRYSDEDGVRQTGSLKGEDVSLLADFNPCHNQRCLRLYYTIEHPDTLVLKTSTPDPTWSGESKVGTTHTLQLHTPNAPTDVRTTFFCNLDKKSLHVVELRSGECGGQTDRTLLVLADWASGELSVLFDETGYGDDSGNYRVLGVYATRAGWNADFKYQSEYAGGDPGKMSCADKRYRAERYIYITEDRGEGMVTSNGEYVLDENEMIRSRVVLHKEGWYEIVDDKLQPVQP